MRASPPASGSAQQLVKPSHLPVLVHSGSHDGRSVRDQPVRGPDAPGYSGIPGGLVRLEIVDAWKARVALQACRSEECGTDAAGEERVAAAAGGRAKACDLVDGVRGEGAGAL